MKYIVLVVLLGAVFNGVAQGPPITADNPIMLGGNSFTAKTLVEIRNTARGTSVYIPAVLQYLPTANSLVGISLPYLSYDLGEDLEGNGLADIKLLGKYQFLRRDGMGKTFRMVAKTVQSLPTGDKLDLMGLSTGYYEGYYGMIAGYETLKFGISSELGYNWMPDGSMDEFRAKLGFGLPLLKPQYPNKQVNLYFEYTSAWLTERDWYQLLYAQGVQYAAKAVTFDLAVELPLIQQFPESRALKYSLFFGMRYTF